MTCMFGDNFLWNDPGDFGDLTKLIERDAPPPPATDAALASQMCTLYKRGVATASYGETYTRYAATAGTSAPLTLRSG